MVNMLVILLFNVFPMTELTIMTEKMTLLFVSGTLDKLMAGSIIASGGVANGMDVDIFVSFWALMNFKKGQAMNGKFSYEGAEMEKQVMDIMKKKKVAPWIETLRSAKEIGNVKIYGCAMFADLMEIKKEELDPIVDDIIGVAEFVSLAKDSNMMLFI